MQQITYLLNMSIEGVNFDVMKDIYKGEFVPLKEFPDEEFEAEVIVGPSSGMADEGGNERAEEVGIEVADEGGNVGGVD